MNTQIQPSQVTVSISRESAFRDTPTYTTTAPFFGLLQANFGPDSSDRVFVITQKTDLMSLAYNFYQDKNLWWAIAAANNIVDPLVLPLGSSIFIPSLGRILNAL